MKISVILTAFGHYYPDDLAALIDTAIAADEAGIDQIMVTDHLAIGGRTDRYPYGQFPYPPEEPWPEPLTTLAAIAGATKRVRLGTGVLIAPLRSALLLAKTVATLDVLSRGRVDLGVGTGWQAEEFEGAGVPFEGRFARMDETLRACRVLWSEAPASFQGETVSFDGLFCEPRPVQARLPVWLGVKGGAKNFARIVDYGDGWMPLGLDLDELQAGIDRLRADFESAGRPADSLGVRYAPEPVVGGKGRVDLDATLETLPGLAARGVTAASFALPVYARRLDDVPAVFEKLAAAKAA